MKKILIIWIGIAFLCGCSGISRHEYRYRVFYGLDLPAKENLSSEEFSRLFYPLGSLNRSLDLFGEEGYTLYDYRRLGDSQNYIFVFRRPREKGSLDTRPSRHLDGIYQFDKDDSQILLAVISTPEGAQVVDLKGVIQIHPSQIEDNEVVYDTAEGRVVLTYTPEGDMVMNLETMSGNTSITKKYRGQKLGKTDEGSK